MRSTFSALVSDYVRQLGPHDPESPAAQAVFDRVRADGVTREFFDCLRALAEHSQAKSAALRADLAARVPRSEVRPHLVAANDGELLP